MVIALNKSYYQDVNELAPIATTSAFADQLKGLVLDGLVSPESKRAYARGIDEFLAWFEETRLETGFSKATVQASRAHLLASGLAPSTVNVRLSAIRRLASEAADNGFLPPPIAAAIGRVKGVRREGR